MVRHSLKLKAEEGAISARCDGGWMCFKRKGCCRSCQAHQATTPASDHHVALHNACARIATTYRQPLCYCLHPVYINPVDTPPTTTFANPFCSERVYLLPTNNNLASTTPHKPISTSASLSTQRTPIHHPPSTIHLPPARPDLGLLPSCFGNPF